MAKKIKKKEEEIAVDPILFDEDLLAPEPKEDKPKILIGYHPITGAEVWQ